MSRDNLLMVADTENDADMLYAVGVFVPDPFIYLRANGRPTIILSDLELDRARRAAPHCRVVSLTRIQERLRKDGAKKTGLPQAIRHLLRPHVAEQALSLLPAGGRELVDRLCRHKSTLVGARGERLFRCQHEAAAYVQ